MFISTAQWVILLLLTALGLAVEVWALIACLRHPAPNYPRAGKRSKRFWLLILLAASLVGFLCVPLSPAGGVLPIWLGLGAAAAAGVYLADVEPALRQLRGRGGRRGSSEGPYGPW